METPVGDVRDIKQLRDYQLVACDYISHKLENYTRPFVYVLACGTGKSLCISELAKRWGRTLVLTTAAELVKQDYEECVEYGVPASIYSASLGEKEVGDVTISTIQSAYKHPELFGWADLVIIDEVQSVDPSKPNSMFMKLLVELNKAKKQYGKTIKIVGLTATAYRNVQKMTMKGRWHSVTTYLQPLNRIPMKGGFLWSSIEEGITTKDAINRGYLTPVNYYTEPQPGNLVVNTTGAEFTDESVGEWGDNAMYRCASVMKGAEENWNIRSGIVAVPFIRHAEALQGLCNASGMSTIVVSSNTPPKARERAIKAFKAGEVRWLLQCNIANVGFNSPITDTLVWARPTLSLNLWQQAVGRIMRLSEGKSVARVLDLVGTYDTFGKVEDIHIGREDGFKTTIEGSKGKLSGKPLATFHWSKSIKRDTMDEK